MKKERYRRMYELEKKEVLSDEEEDELKIESEIFMNDINNFYDVEGDNVTYKIHRIVLEDILIDPGTPPEEGIDRSLSIPFHGDIRSVWAPNGYGKTFAFKILGLLKKCNSSESLQKYLHNFFTLCLDEINPRGVMKTTNLIPNDMITSTILKKNLIPFSEIKFRLVDSKNQVVVDISAKPDWKSLLVSRTNNVQIPPTEIKRKFWNRLSLESTFFKKYPDIELEEILGSKSFENSSSIIEPNFLQNSFILPVDDSIRFFDLETETLDEIEMMPASSILFSPNIRDKIGTEISLFVQLILSENGNIEIMPTFDKNELEIFKNISRFITSERGWNDLEEHVRNGEELLLDLFELSKIYPLEGGLWVRDDILAEYADKAASDGVHIPISCSPLNYLFILFDMYLHEYNPPNSNYPKEDFEEVDDDYLDNYEGKKIGISTIYSIPWRLYDESCQEIESYAIGGYSRGSDLNADNEIMERGMPMYWEDIDFGYALENFDLRYFEIPNIINYSSDQKLHRSQSDMSELLHLIKHNYNNTRKTLDTDLNNKHGEYYPVKDSQYNDTYNLLMYIKSTMGDHHDTLNLFLGPLTGWNRWNDLLYQLEKGKIDDPSMQYFPNLLSSDFSFVLEQILGFVEIFENINESLNSPEAESWAASCRFNNWNTPMKFMDPKIGYDIESQHLSFGQCSVVALEVCIGAGILIHQDPNVNKRSLQSCIILDEPEIGRSEHWVNKISERIFELIDDIDKPTLGNIFDQSFTIVSHRESLLRSLSKDNNYYVMQPISSRNNYSRDLGEEE